MSLVDLGYYENEPDDLSEISNLLKEIPLYNLYDKLDKELDNNEATYNCNECNTMLSGTDQDVPQLLQLCKIFCNILSKASDFNLHCNDTPCNSSFRYMSFWLYSKVKKITDTSTIIEKFYQVLQTMSKNPRYEMKYCDIKNFNTIHEKFTNFKYLYEFLFTYYDINKKISAHHNREDRLYCNHIKENFRFYNNIKESCANLRSCTYYTELQRIKEKVVNPTDLSEIYRKCNYVQTPCKEDSDETNDIPCVNVKDSNFPLPIINPEPDKVAKNIFHGLTYSIPTLATLTMLYKFTPIGSWLYSKIKRTNNMEKNTNAENYYISHHNTRIEGIDPGNSSNNTY